MNLNANKKFDINVVVYYVKKNFIKSNEYSIKSFIQSIMFLFKLLNSIEIRYWSIEMKVVDIIWVLRKIRHFIESFISFIVIYIDHNVTLNIIKQITFSFSSTNKLNFRLVRINDYIQRFDLNIRHKSNKSYLVSNVLFKLIILNDSQTSSEKKLDVFFIFVDVDINHSDANVYFTCSLVKMNETFRQKILDDYKVDVNWKRILSVLNIENDVNFSFERENHEFIFRVDDSIDDHAFIFRRFCISNAVVKDVLKIVHENSNDHSKYAKCYEQIASTWYIRDLTRQLRDYLKYCSKCQINRIRRHQSHDSLQSILSSIISFHTFNLNFIFALSVSRVEQFNVVMSITCKFTKRIIIVLDKNIWTVAQWDRTLLNQLDLDDWKLFKMLIFDRNRKFIRNLWREIFTRLDVKLLYNTIYHSQIDEQSKRTNQTIEIAFRFLINVLNNFANWIEIISDIQRNINNSIIIVIDKTSNEISYEFTLTQIFDLLKSFEESSLSLSQMIRQKAVDVLIFAQMNFKFYYDRKHQSINLVVDDWTQIRFHKNYDISSIAVLSNKFNQQYIAFFRVTKKIDRLAYRLNIFRKWIIHSIFSIAQLKSCFDSINDFFRRHRLTQSNFVFVEKNTDLIKSFELKRIVNKRMIVRREVEYLIRWKNYESEYDVWRNLSKLSDVMNLIQRYEMLETDVEDITWQSQ